MNGSQSTKTENHWLRKWKKVKKSGEGNKNQGWVLLSDLQFSLPRRHNLRLLWILCSLIAFPIKTQEQLMEPRWDICAVTDYSNLSMSVMEGVTKTPCMQLWLLLHPKPCRQLWLFLVTHNNLTVRFLC